MCKTLDSVGFIMMSQEKKETFECITFFDNFISVVLDLFSLLILTIFGPTRQVFS